MPVAAQNDRDWITREKDEEMISTSERSTDNCEEAWQVHGLALCRRRNGSEKETFDF